MITDPPEVNEQLRLTIFASFPEAMSRAQRHKELATLRGHRARLRCMLLAPPRPAQLAAAASMSAETPPMLTLFTGGEDGDIRVWSLPDGKCVARLEGHTSWVNCFVLSDDGATLVSGSGDTTARVWDVSTPGRSRCKHVLGPRGFDERGDEVQPGHEGWVLSVGLRGSMLATAGADTHVRLWDIRSGECLAVLEGASKGNLAVGIIPNPATPE